MTATPSFAVLVLGALTAGCYDVPLPDCGFVCGPNGECPSDYTCDTSDNRCHRQGTAVACESGFDEVDTGDRTAPLVLGFTPLHDEQDVFVTTPTTVTFSERVVGASPVTIIVAAGGVAVPATVTYDLLTNTAELVPSVPLAPMTTYTVTVTDDLIDLAGNPLPGPTSWQFTTATPPELIARFPLPGATNVDVSTKVYADFDEPIFGVTTATFTLMAGTAPVAGAATTAEFPHRATYTPDSQLAANTEYQTRLTTVIRDLKGNAILNAISWTFTTGADTVPPILVQETPLPDRTFVDVTASASLRFDEPVVIPAGSFTLTQGGAAVAATLTQSNANRNALLRPVLQLFAETTYTVTATAAITDLAGNPFVGSPRTWSFTTGPDEFGPRRVANSPLHAASAVPTSSVITVQFDEPVANVSASSFMVNGGAIAGTISLSLGDTLVTFTPSAPLPGNTTFAVNLSTAITDAVGNPLGTPILISFTTAP